METRKRWFFRDRKEQNKTNCFIVEKVYFDNNCKITDIFTDAIFETRKEAENWAWRRNIGRQDVHDWFFHNVLE